MEFRNLFMPGLVTRFASNIRVQIIGQEDTKIDLVISYEIGSDYDPGIDYSKYPERFGEIKFETVIEYRFGWDTFIYDDFPEITATAWKVAADNDLALTEIIGSPYLERMRSSGLRSHLEDRMGGGEIKEADVKHYRIEFDKYGRFDVLALGVATREYELP